MILSLTALGKTLSQLHNSGIIHGNLDLQSVLINFKSSADVSVRLVGFSHGIHSSEADDKATEIRGLEKDLENKSPTLHADLTMALHEGYEMSLLDKEHILERISISRLKIIW